MQRSAESAARSAGGTALAARSREAPVLIAGPTASGKSALAMELAARDGRTIVNADALQVYASWRILTARPTLAEEAALPHALYGHVARDEAWSVGDWLRAVTPLLAQPVVIVGGTGLYFSALTRGLVTLPDIPAGIRAEADNRRATEGIASLLAELDAETAARIDRANPARVQRAWEVLRATGRGLASWQAETGPPLLPIRDCDALVLTPSPGWLNPRIDARFHRMMEEGALEEARAERPFWDPARPVSRAIGAAELMAHLDGTLPLDEAIAAAQLASRQYAKRQRTWFRSQMRDWRVLTQP